MWTIAQYLPVSPFSLKSAAATASGGKTLLVPTPYAIKMALLDVAIRCYGIQEGERLFPLLRDLRIAFAAPDDLVVMKSFSKIRRLLKDKSNAEKARKADEQKNWPLQSTIAYREYVYYRDPFRLALSHKQENLPSIIATLLSRINYLGKRGCFIQAVALPRREDELDRRFVELTPEATQAFPVDGTLQMLDDCGKTLTFQRANVYTSERITVGKERVLHHVVLPYRLLRSSRNYSWYQYIQEGSR